MLNVEFEQSKSQAVISLLETYGSDALRERRLVWIVSLLFQLLLFSKTWWQNRLRIVLKSHRPITASIPVCDNLYEYWLHLHEKKDYFFHEIP